MNLTDAIELVIKPGLALLPANMDTPEARLMLLTIGMQESNFKYRRQVNGPAHGYYQFEQFGGVGGVMRHKATREILHDILDRLNIAHTTNEVFRAIVYHDALATVLARLLLWTIPRPLPAVDSIPQESWNYYIEAWRPGKPHRDTWESYRAYSLSNMTVYEA